MTILTSSNDKKKLLLSAVPATTTDVEADPTSFRQNSVRAKTTTCWLVFLMAILVLLMGVLAGVCFYRSYLREKVQRLNCMIPYSSRDVDNASTFWVNKHFRDGPTYTYNDALKMMQNDVSDEEDSDLSRDQGIRNLLNEFFNQLRDDFNNPMKDIRSMESEIGLLDEKSIREKWFQEEVEIQNDDADSYADIKVPDFKDGRRGRFIHDFKNNLTTIVDEEAKRCFVYPLDYETTMPPQSIIDVFTKMQSGYYFPDTTTLNKKMRVILPQLELDDNYISPRTLMVCENMRIYRLEPIVSGVYKRSVTEPIGEQGKFAEFVGKIVLYDLENIHEVSKYEEH